MSRRIRILLARLVSFVWVLLPDQCDKCHGRHGGVRGNENLIVNEHGREERRCDYCS